MVDLLWEEFRQNYWVSDPLTDYPVQREDGIYLPHHDPDADMAPFEPLVNRDGLNGHYTREIYISTHSAPLL